MNLSDSTTPNLALVSWTWISSEQSTAMSATTMSATSIYARPQQPKFDLFKPLRQWLDQIKVDSPDLAHTLCKFIPAQCPFERDVKLFSRVLFHIPPMCKLNPLYEEVVSLRFRALCYLADECGEDVTRYC